MNEYVTEPKVINRYYVFELQYSHVTVHPELLLEVASPIIRSTSRAHELNHIFSFGAGHCFGVIVLTEELNAGGRVPVCIHDPDEQDVYMRVAPYGILQGRLLKELVDAQHSSSLRRSSLTFANYLATFCLPISIGRI